MRACKKQKERERERESERARVRESARERERAREREKERRERGGGRREKKRELERVSFVLGQFGLQLRLSPAMLRHALHNRRHHASAHSIMSIIDVLWCWGVAGMHATQS